MKACKRVFVLILSFVFVLTGVLSYSSYDVEAATSMNKVYADLLDSKLKTANNADGISDGFQIHMLDSGSSVPVYRITDIDKDGTSELLVGVCVATDYVFLTDIYTYKKDGSWKHLIGTSFSKDRLYINKKGLIVYHFDQAGASGENYYRIYSSSLVDTDADSASYKKMTFYQLTDKAVKKVKKGKYKYKGQSKCKCGW